MAFITLPKYDYRGWNVRQKHFSRDDSLSMSDFRFSLFVLWNFKCHYTVYCTFAAILGIFKLCLDKNPIKSGEQKQKARIQWMKTLIILQTHSSLSIVVLFCIVELQYKTVGIVPLSAEPTLSEHLSHKFLPSGSGSARGYPQPTGGFRASP